MQQLCFQEAIFEVAAIKDKFDTFDISKIPYSDVAVRKNTDHERCTKLGRAEKSDDAMDQSTSTRHRASLDHIQPSNHFSAINS